ncbi:MAG: FAD-binding oxidoreductase [Caldilineales bacterium]|nr:FAD-binding oxidoreductase [Caldilineales bacterium]MCW5856837.1 FAD-binding oxidoreductase [Caldilineales bacterium]
MKRWNGWGDEQVEHPLPPAAAGFLADAIGPPQARATVPLVVALATVPPGRLPSLLSDHPLLDTGNEDRLRHARGQSLPDWVALRYGAIDRYPDAVAYPADEEQVGQLITLAQQTGARLIPYGGGSSVVGHINPPPGDEPVLTVDMGRLSRLIDLNESDRLATFGAGVTGPHLEAQLRAHGLTLGHFPQSFEFSTLGGWIATQSSGQQSLYYGRIADLFAGGRVIAPTGVLDLPPFPASAAGPDLRQLVLGSEGRLGIITRAAVRIRPAPVREDFHAIFFPTWAQALAATRDLAQAQPGLAMLRASDPVETATTLLLAGHERAIGMVELLLKSRGVGDGKCMLLFGVSGDDETVQRLRHAALGLTAHHAGVHLGRRMGSEWRKSRFRTPYLRNTLWDYGYAVDTLETALPWSQIEDAQPAVLAALRTGLAASGERVHAFSHLSHFYPSGASLYITYLFRLAPTARETLARWQTLKHAASQEIVRRGGTISHQHGVGVDHLPYLAAEKGELGLTMLSNLARTLDPDGIMNPGKLVAG